MERGARRPARLRRASSYDNTGALGANRWRHVAFIEQEPVGRPTSGMRWLMSSDVCKHCTHAACLDVCPTGAIFRTEFGTVVVQQDVCNGCGYCVLGLPVRRDRPRREGDGRVWKCTLCYDRLKDGMEPACAKACPTDSIQFGPLDELRGRGRARRARAARARRDVGPALRRRPGRRRRRLRRVLPAARRAGGLRAAARPGGHDPRPARRCGARPGSRRARWPPAWRPSCCREGGAVSARRDRRGSARGPAVLLRPAGGQAARSGPARCRGTSSRAGSRAASAALALRRGAARGTSGSPGARCAVALCAAIGEPARC